MIKLRETRSLSVCIVSHNAYGAIHGGSKGFIGGVEWQTSLLARWLASRGHIVSFVTWDEGGPRTERIDGINVLKLCRQDAGIPGLRFFHPRWSSLVSILRHADADVYYQNGAEPATGQVALWCKRNNRRFVFALASNADCAKPVPFFTTPRDQLLYQYGLRHASAVISQTETQSDLLKHIYGVTSNVIPMPCAGPTSWAPRPRVQSRPPAIGWLGRIAPVKRPHLFLELARQFPEGEFHLAGPVGPDQYSMDVIREAKEVPNVKVHGRIAKEEVWSFLSNMTYLCCTSEYEGFPNTFLEAFGMGVPLLTTFDPDSIVQRHSLGAVATDVAGLKAQLTRLEAEHAQYTEMSRRCWEYYRLNHSLDNTMPRFESAFLASKANSPR